MKLLPVEEIREQLRGVGKGEKSAIVERYANLFGCSRFTIYRELRKTFGKSKTVVRAKKIEDSVIHEAAKLKRSGETMHLSEREISSELVIEILRNRSVPGSDKLTVATLNRRLNEKGYRERTPYVRVEAQYSNQQHQLDFSRSKYFQLMGYDQDKKDYVLRVSGRELHYKLEDGQTKLRTWIVSLVDAYSRVKYVQAYPARGEDISLGLEHLHAAYNGEFLFQSDVRFYLPDRLKTDQGAFAKNGAVKGMLKALEIIPELAEAGKHRGNQKVEASFRNYWQRFELPLAIKMGNGTKIYLREYNELAADFVQREAERKHPLRASSRIAVYRSGLMMREQRVIKQDLRDIAFTVIERTVSESLTVSINNELFEAPRYAVGKRIKVYANLNGDYAGEMISDGDQKSFILKPTRGYVEVGDFSHRPHNTYKQDIDQELKDDKIKFMKPREKRVKASTPVTSATHSDGSAQGEKFESLEQMQAYVMERLPGVAWEDLEYVFSNAFDEGMFIENVDLIIKSWRMIPAAN